jgi:hypothetical protein
MIQGFLYDIARGMRGDVNYIENLVVGYAHGQEKISHSGI